MRKDQPSHGAEALARRLAVARAAMSALSLPAEAFPTDLAGAYVVQDRLIARGAPPRAWKVGHVAPDRRFGLPLEWFCGPVPMLRRAAGASDAVDVEVIAGGFAAVEAEIILELAVDVPPRSPAPLQDLLRALVGRVFVGAELAGSPLPNILDLGPIGAICDHGNCLAVLVGRELDPAILEDLSACEVTVRMDDAALAHGPADTVPGGPLRALDFLLANLAERGIALTAGTLVSTGAMTGVHPIAAGQTASIVFDSAKALEIAVTSAPVRPA